ncbi:MAG: peroxiredoxin, partial [Bryobacterales bacterium]|nr:peroxiredoxin [Bryobacterales bacterium]
EACAFRDAHEEFCAKNCVIIGVSADSIKSHERFSARHHLPFRLVSDPDHTISESYGAWRQKTLFGRKYMGIVRSTFVIGADGRIEASYDQVKVVGHVGEVLASL